MHLAPLIALSKGNLKVELQRRLPSGLEFTLQRAEAKGIQWPGSRRRGHEVSIRSFVPAMSSQA